MLPEEKYDDSSVFIFFSDFESTIYGLRNKKMTQENYGSLISQGERRARNLLVHLFLRVLCDG